MKVTALTSRAQSRVQVLPAKPGDIVYFYATGLGERNPAVADGDGGGTTLHWAALPATVILGATPAPVLFSGQAPGFPGVDQIDILIPQNAPIGAAIPITMIQSDGTLTSGLATIPIQ